MNTRESLIVRDFLRRHAFFLMTLFGSHVATSTVFFLSGSFAPLLLIIVVYLDYGKKARALLTLPLSVTEVARALRFCLLVIPIVLCSVALLIGAGFAFLLEAPLLSVEAVIHLAVVQALLIGCIFFVRSGRVRFSGVLPDSMGSVVNLLAGMLVTVVFSSYVLNLNLLPRQFSEMGAAQYSVLALMAVLAVAGWFRSSDWILNQGSERRSGTTGRKPLLENRSWARFGGMRYAALMLVAGMLLVIAIWLPAFWGIEMIVQRPRAISMWAWFAFSGLPLLQICVSGFFLHQLRMLRTLPMPVWKLAALPTVLPALATIVCAAVLAWLFRTFGWLEVGDGAPMVFALIGCVGFLLMVPVVLYWGRFYLFQGVFVLTVFFPLPMLHLFVGFGDLNVVHLLGVSVIAALGVWWLSMHLLAGPRPWATELTR